MFAFAATD